jgi:uncharacterized protein (UPF0332 family)
MNDQQRADLVKYRYNKSVEAFGEAQQLVENEMWNLAVNRLYYACYYCVSALLVQNNILSKSHLGSRQMFGLHFVKTGIVAKETAEYYAKIFTFRQKGDYEDFFDYDREDVLYLIEPARNLINEIARLLRQQTSAHFDELQ